MPHDAMHSSPEQDQTSLSASKLEAPVRRSAPTYASFPSSVTQLAAGVAIFHIASSRVVVCYHSRDGWWFLPKGRKDVGESIEEAACREGFEESGYRNRLLPLPHRHHQPQPVTTHSEKAEGQTDPIPALTDAWSTEPILTELMPNGPEVQYFLFWYVAETLPPAEEESINERQADQSQALHVNLPPDKTYRTLDETTREEKLRCGDDYEPPCHANTGVDEEESHYKSFLLTIPEAIEKLARTSSTMVSVVQSGWEAIEQRMSMEQFVSKN